MIELQLHDPGREPVPSRQHYRQGRARRLAVVRRHEDERRTCGGFVRFPGAPTGDLTQGLGGSRVILVCDPNLPRNERTFDRQFRTECMRPAGPSSEAADMLYQGTRSGTSCSGWDTSTTTSRCSRTSRWRIVVTCKSGSRCTSVQHGTGRHDRYGRDVQLHDRRDDRSPELRERDEHAQQLGARDSARRSVHVLSTSNTLAEARTTRASARFFVLSVRTQTSGRSPRPLLRFPPEDASNPPGSPDQSLPRTEKVHRLFSRKVLS